MEAQRSLRLNSVILLTDGLVDCDDNDCCAADVCAENVNCLAAPEPQEVLLREQAPADSASFYERVRFLIRDNGVQNFADRNAFDPKYDLLSFLKPTSSTKITKMKSRKNCMKKH